MNLAFAVGAAFALTLPISAGAFLLSDRAPFAVERAGLLADLKAMPGDHLVFVDYGPNHNVHEEWVYNRADIDASRVVWARSIDSDRDRELIDYFSGRVVWYLKVDGRDPVLKPHPMVQRGAADLRRPASCRTGRCRCPIQRKKGPGKAAEVRIV